MTPGIIKATAVLSYPGKDGTMRGTISLPQPAAWLGYAVKPTGGFVVRVCAWCPDKAEADRLAHAAGLEVTHCMCVSCYQIQLSDLLGETNE